jgi:hypothetical protein
MLSRIASQGDRPGDSQGMTVALADRLTALVAHASSRRRTARKPDVGNFLRSPGCPGRRCVVIVEAMIVDRRTGHSRLAPRPLP